MTGFEIDSYYFWKRNNIIPTWHYTSCNFSKISVVYENTMEIFSPIPYNNGFNRVRVFIANLLNLIYTSTWIVADTWKFKSLSPAADETSTFAN